VGTLWCPAHLLFLDHALADHLVDRGFGERGGDGFARAPRAEVGLPAALFGLVAAVRLPAPNGCCGPKRRASRTSLTRAADSVLDPAQPLHLAAVTVRGGLLARLRN